MPFNEVFFGKGHRFAMERDDSIIDPASERWELWMPRRYKDASRFGDKWAICFGHVEGGENEPKVITEDMEFTIEEGRAIHRLDLDSKARWLRKKIHVPVTVPMFGALNLITMNTGEGNLEKGRILGFLNAGKYISAGAAFLDHRFKWIAVLDASGQPVINPETGEPLRERVEDNGLIMRRGFEIGIYGTKVN